MSTYVPIQAITLSSPTTSVTFSGIPQTYTDLVLVCSVANSTNQQDVRINVNGDSGTNYSFTQVFGTGSSASSNRGSNYNWGLAGYIGTTQSNSITHFQNYSNTTTNKTMITRYNDPANLVVAAVSLWRSTAAINQIVVSFLANNFVAGSTFTLYGVGSGSPKAFGGDEVRTDGTFWYHIFRSSGRFEPVQALSCDYLVVAGGGGSTASYGSGGGGAGGLRCTVGATGGGGSLETPLSLSANTGYTITVGAGGVAATQGSNSVFSTITSTGGGIGRGFQVNGSTGGSGGGAGGRGSFTGGAGTANQGFAGGNTGVTNIQEIAGGGGGGGAGAVGAASTSGANSSFMVTAGAGGNGVTTSISGTSTTYAGGGGGGAFNDGSGGRTRGLGGSGGGGNGGAGKEFGGVVIDATATNGTANTGGGGGGAFYPGQTPGNGGSGIVIVRYAV